MTDEKLAKFYSEIGLKIRSYRKAANMKPEFLAKELQLSRVSILNMELGRHKPPIHVLMRIASVLQVPYTNLIPLDSEEMNWDNTNKIVSSDKRWEKGLPQSLSSIFPSTQNK